MSSVSLARIGSGQTVTVRVAAATADKWSEALYKPVAKKAVSLRHPTGGRLTNMIRRSRESALVTSSAWRDTSAAVRRKEIAPHGLQNIGLNEARAVQKRSITGAVAGAVGGGAAVGGVVAASHGAAAVAIPLIAVNEVLGGLNLVLGFAHMKRAIRAYRMKKQFNRQLGQDGFSEQDQAILGATRHNWSRNSRSNEAIRYKSQQVAGKWTAADQYISYLAADRLKRKIKAGKRKDGEIVLKFDANRTIDLQALRSLGYTTIDVIPETEKDDAPNVMIADAAAQALDKRSRHELLESERRLGLA